MEVIQQNNESASAAFRTWLEDHTPAECLWCGAQGESLVIFTPFDVADAATFGLGADEMLFLSVCRACRWKASDEKLIANKVRETAAKRSVARMLAMATLGVAR